MGALQQSCISPENTDQLLLQGQPAWHCLASQGLLELPAVLPARGNTNGFGKEGDIATRSLMLLQAQPGRGSSRERSWALLLLGFKHVLSLSSHSH